ncbi:MAG: efflux RND transporter periplasmic adaptor subunit [Desulfuromusa sp.]|nr:efflux RND transporter periplasmic adaptor subunit [Desulfuromusa sp.]
MKTYNSLIFMTVLGLFSLSILTACNSQKENDPQDTVKPVKVVPVAIETVVLRDLTETFILPANLEAWEDLTLAAEIAGSVQRIHFAEGDRVQSGKTLLEIDPETIKSILHRDQQNVTVMERKLKRYRQLETEGLISPQELDDLENGLTAAKAALQATRLQLAKSFPRAPVSGIIDRLYIDRGEYVDPGKPLLRLVQIEKLKVIVDVPEKDVSFLKVGQQVEIIPATINTHSSTAITGIINFIAFSANDITRTYRTKIVIDNSSIELRPGMIVRAKFVRQRLEQVVSVPLYAVMDRDGEKIVFLAEDGLARKVKVSIGNSIGQRVVIKEGLIAAQALIIEGQQLLVDGARIDVGITK